MGYKQSPIEKGSLRYRLKHGTKDIHDVADKAMTNFLFSDLAPTQSQQAYRHFLLQLHVLYKAMEEELNANQSHPSVGPIYFPDELSRLRLLEEDLDYFYDDNWRHLLNTDITSAMHRYAARIREIGKSQPELLISHSYTRYLGDMSGGQILRRIIKKRYSLPEEKGLRFFEFDHVESIAKFKDLYTARMNSINLSEAAMMDQVEEARRIFQFNIDVFEEVGAMYMSTQNSQSNSLATTNEPVVTDIRTRLPSQWSTAVKMASLTLCVTATAVMLSPLLTDLLT